jgi:hypothetical protein
MHRRDRVRDLHSIDIVGERGARGVDLEPDAEDGSRYITAVIIMSVYVEVISVQCAGGPFSHVYPQRYMGDDVVLEIAIDKHSHVLVKAGKDHTNRSSI